MAWGRPGELTGRCGFQSLRARAAVGDLQAFFSPSEFVFTGASLKASSVYASLHPAVCCSFKHFVQDKDGARKRRMRRKC